MHSTDEPLHEIMQRSENIIEMRNIRSRIIAAGASAFACVIMLYAVSLYIPHITLLSQENTQTQYGSLLLATPYLGYIIIGVLAFALGICVTILCINWKKLKEKERK